MANYKINNLYQGGYSTFDSDYGSVFTGYRTAAGSLSMTTDPRTADIVTDIRNKIAPGLKNVEVTMVSPELFESVPQQHLKEVNRLAKLTGVDITVHGPLIEASGISREGFSEANREAAERQMNLAVERSYEMNPNGNFPVTFHSSAILPGPEMMKDEEGNIAIKKALVINKETGQINAAKEETKYYPYPEGIKIDGSPYSLEKGSTLTIKKEINAMNNSEWENSIAHAISQKIVADRLIDENYPLVREVLPAIQKGEMDLRKHPELAHAYNKIINAQTQLDNVRLEAQSLFNKAYKYGSDENKKVLKEIANSLGQGLMINDPKVQSETLQKMLNVLNNGHGEHQFQPEVYQLLDDFSRDKSTTTFANVALNSYKKFKDKAPIVSVENPPVGTAFATGEDLKKIIEESRKKFVKTAVDKGVMSEKEAKKQAERLLGVTWDVGHINMMRKHGFESEDIIKQSKAVAPFVKHVHLSDNFGFEHTELPMGMGNVPLKEIMEKLGKKGFEAKKVIEAAQWWQHFKTSPFKESIHSMSSPIYSMKMPYWNQSIGLQQDYLGGYGEIFPPVSFETFGASFSGLPKELGGQRQGGGSRLTGRSME